MRRPTPVKLAAILIATCLGMVRAHADPASVDRNRLLNAAAEPANWLAKGGDWRGEFFSPLTRINTDNVGSLGVAWEYDATPHRGRVLRGMEATPVIVDGVLYTSLAWSEVVALDAATGRELWRYDPKVEESADRKGCCDGVNRGVAVWKGRLYVGTMDGFLIAVDARDGHELWRTDTLIDHKRSYTITGAPQVAGRVVVIGNSGSEFGVRGYVSAYDLDTGALRWRFYTVPGDPKLGFEHPELKWAAKTWSPQSDWVTGGGGTVWDGMAYDPQLNLLYFGTANSNPYPNWFRSPGNSDNLFLASILALDPDTGRLKWHYQATPGEMWDYDATQPMVLADLQLQGRSRKVLMQANKNGFFYVLDRATGKLLSAKDYVYVNWASRVDLKTGRPVLTGQGWYKDEPKLIFPAQTGGHNWMPMSYDPQTGLVYIPTIDTPMLFTAAPSYQFHIGEFNMGAGGAFPPVDEKYLDPKHPAEMREQLTAWDPVAQREVWKVPLGGLLQRWSAQHRRRSRVPGDFGRTFHCLRCSQWPFAAGYRARYGHHGGGFHLRGERRAVCRGAGRVRRWHAQDVGQRCGRTDLHQPAADRCFPVEWRSGSSPAAARGWAAAESAVSRHGQRRDYRAWQGYLHDSLCPLSRGLLGDGAVRLSGSEAHSARHVHASSSRSCWEGCCTRMGWPASPMC